MSDVREYLEDTHKNVILGAGFKHRDRWYEKDEFKIHPLRSGDMFITKDGATIFHGLCLDGVEMKVLFQMLEITERQ